MFKDFKKYLTTTLKIYLFLLIMIFILKVVGLDYFGMYLMEDADSEEERNMIKQTLKKMSDK